MPAGTPLKELKFKTAAQYRKLVDSLPTTAAAGFGCHMIRDAKGRPMCTGPCSLGRRCSLEFLEDVPFLIVKCMCKTRP